MTFGQALIIGLFYELCCTIGENLYLLFLKYLDFVSLQEEFKKYYFWLPVEKKLLKFSILYHSNMDPFLFKQLKIYLLLLLWDICKKR